MELLYDSAILLLGIYLKKNENTNSRKKTCPPMFMASLFTTTKMWIQPKCPSVDEWIKKAWYLYTI